MKLDSYQADVVSAVREGNNCLVIAGPGAGKTFVAEVISRLPLGKVAFLTHTRAAKWELHRRGVKASTIHSLCYRGLGGPIFDSFDSLLIYRGENDFEWVVVDEAQDLSYAQYEVLKSLGKHYVLVGDPYQSIFNFSDAYADIFNSFRGDFSPVELPLLYNYRSNEQIVGRLEEVYSRGLISRCSGKTDSSLAVLVRTRLLAEGISALLRRESISHLLVTGDHPKEAESPLYVMTVHCSKGTEFDDVLIVPWNRQDDESERLYYVALARARYRANLIQPLEVLRWIEESRQRNLTESLTTKMSR